jgi:hypothetical protein
VNGNRSNPLSFNRCLKSSTRASARMRRSSSTGSSFWSVQWPHGIRGREAGWYRLRDGMGNGG